VNSRAAKRERCGRKARTRRWVRQRRGCLPSLAPSGALRREQSGSARSRGVTSVRPARVAIGTPAPAATCPPCPRRLVLQRDAARSGCPYTQGRGRLCPDDARFCGRASPVSDRGDAHARTRALATPRIAGRSCASSQALGSEGAAAEAPCAHMWLGAPAPAARRQPQQLDRGRLLTHHAVTPVNRAKRHGGGERRERQSSARLLGEENEEEELAPPPLAQTTHCRAAQKLGGAVADITTYRVVSYEFSLLRTLLPAHRDARSRVCVRRAVQ